MRLIDIINGPWAITPEMLQEIVHIYRTHLRGEKIDIEGVENRIGRKLQNDQTPYDIINGVAVIDAIGPLAKRMNLFMQISGGASTQLLEQDLKNAMGNPDVNAVVFNIDSPGGTVDGTFEIAEIIYSYRGQKPMVAYADGLMASAAYAIGSAADRVISSGDTAYVGSIGVIATHVDVTKAEESMGFKTTQIKAGKYKDVGSPYKPLTKTDREIIQADVDYLYSIFVNRVARNRDVDIDTVLNDMAEGKIFIGQQAVAAGLVDGVSTFDDVIASLAAGELPATSRAGDAHKLNLSEATMSSDNHTPEITVSYVSSNHPDVAEALREEGRAEGKTLGADQERERIKSVREQSMPGHDALIEEMMFDGKTSGPEAAVRILKAEKETQDKIGQDIEKDAPEPVNSVSEETKLKADKVDDNAPLEECCKAEWEKDSEVRAEFDDNYDAYLSFRRAEENNLVKIRKAG